jgi:predicted Rossmann fold nucleotide-binding protein DprA/Smf involved in DNA uptake
MAEEIVKKKVAVVGSRDFADKHRLYDIMTKNYDRIKLVISGGARGADSLAVEWATDYGIPFLVFPALWRDPFTGVQNRGAGFKRNRQIVEQADVVVAFWDGKSPGTAHTIEMAEQLNKPVRIVKFAPPTPPTEPPMLGVKGAQKVAVEPTPEPPKPTHAPSSDDVL